MIKIGKYPILIHIINHYLKYGFNDFILATGYKNQVFKKYFKNYKKLGVPFKSNIKNKECNITILDTGQSTQTGGRLKKISKYLEENKDFMFTYGDGVSSVNLKELLSFHKKNNKLITVTAVRPPARFGEIIIKNSRVVSFQEKPQVSSSWINGGFFVANKNFLRLIRGDKEILEKKPLEKATKLRQLIAYKHRGFWKCMDVKRDRDDLQNIYKKNKFNW